MLPPKVALVDVADVIMNSSAVMFAHLIIGILYEQELETKRRSSDASHAYPVG